MLPLGEPGAFSGDNSYYLVGGTMFLMWLGEQITARGVGNGISLIIFAGIVAEMPAALVGTMELGRTGALSALFIIFLLIMAIRYNLHRVRRTRPAPGHRPVPETTAG